MADILIDNESVPSSPASSKSILYVDSTANRFATLNSSGTATGILSVNNATSSQGAGFSSDTYVTNSGLLIPSCGMQAGQIYRWTITASKTGASTATPVYTVRMGTNQSTSDTSILALTAGAAQTAVADNGILTITIQVRSVSATGVVAGAAAWSKTQTGLIGFGGSIDGVSSSINNASVAGQYVGVSINGGTSAAWTLSSVHAELIG